MVVLTESIRIPFHYETDRGIQRISKLSIFQMSKKCQVNINHYQYQRSYKSFIVCSSKSECSWNGPRHFQLKKVKPEEIAQLFKLSQELEPLDISHINHSVKSVILLHWSNFTYNVHVFVGHVALQAQE